MIGNDIVDLAQARQESNWRRRGYLDKIFTPHEQQLIREASDPDQMVWLLWSLKESAYKLAVRTMNKRVFAPVKIACSLQKSIPGTVNGTVVYGETYQTRSVITAQYISTLAFAMNKAPTYKQIIVPFETTDYQTHQRVIRKKIKQYVSALFNTSDDNIHLTKNSNGAPILTISNSASIPLSISHHGYYGAFVISSTISSLDTRRRLPKCALIDT